MIFPNPNCRTASETAGLTSGDEIVHPLRLAIRSDSPNPFGRYMSSEVTGIIITLFGASALAIAVLGSRFRRKNSRTPEPAVLPRENSIVPVKTPPVEPTPPPSGAPAAFVGAQTQVTSRATPSSRRSGTYVRRAAPKRSTATRDQTQNAPG